MEITTDTLLKFLFMFLGIFAIIFVVTIITPKLAKITDRIIEKLFKNRPARVDDDIYKVKSIYDGVLGTKKADETAENINDNGDVENGKE